MKQVLDTWPGLDEAIKGFILNMLNNGTTRYAWDGDTLTYERRRQFGSEEEFSVIQRVSGTVAGYEFAHQLLNSLKLAFIKLQQMGGFDQVDGVKTPDLTAYNQILNAIRTFDPAFTFGTAPEDVFCDCGITHELNTLCPNGCDGDPNLPPFSVGRTDGTGTVTRYATLAEAEAQIVEIEKTDPTGVHAGDYYVDGPEHMINPPQTKQPPTNLIHFWNK